MISSTSVEFDVTQLTSCTLAALLTSGFSSATTPSWKLRNFFCWKVPASTPTILIVACTSSPHAIFREGSTFDLQRPHKSVVLSPPHFSLQSFTFPLCGTPSHPAQAAFL